MVYISLGLLMNNLPLVLLVLGIGTHVTAIFRLLYTHPALQPWFMAKDAWAGVRSVFLHMGGRKVASYYVKAGLLFLAVLLVRIGH